LQTPFISQGMVVLVARSVRDGLFFGVYLQIYVCMCLFVVLFGVRH